LDTISDIGLYPLISLLLFVAFFVGLLWYVFSISKKDARRNSELPLEDGTSGKTILLVFLGLISFGANAQSAETSKVAGDDELVMALVIIAIVFVALILGGILAQVLTLSRRINARLSPEKQEETTELFSEKW